MLETEGFSEIDWIDESQHNPDPTTWQSSREASAREVSSQKTSIQAVDRDPRRKCTALWEAGQPGIYNACRLTYTMHAV